MNKILFKPIGKLLGSYAFKPVMATPIMTISKKNLYFNFATTKDPKNQGAGFSNKDNKDSGLKNQSKQNNQFKDQNKDHNKDHHKDHQKDQNKDHKKDHKNDIKDHDKKEWEKKNDKESHRNDNVEKKDKKDFDKK